MSGALHHPSKRPAGELRGALVVAGLCALIALAGSAQELEGGQGGLTAQCSLLPADNYWNVPVDRLPVHPATTEAWVAAIGASEALEAPRDGPAAVPQPDDVAWFEVTRPAELVEVAFASPEASDPGPYPIPAEARAAVESTPAPRHLVLLDPSRCVVYELYEVTAGPQGWQAAAGAVFDLRSNDLRPLSRVPGGGAGLPIHAGLLRFAELDRGEVGHALRFTAPVPADGFVWPARRAGRFGAGASPPLGQRFRLRSDLDLEPFSPRVRALLAALQEYGMVLVDVGDAWSLQTAADGAFTGSELSELAQIRGEDFVAVDGALLRVVEDSARVRRQLEMEPVAAPGAGPFACRPSAEEACVGAGRFSVSVDWIADDGQTSPARVSAVRSDDSVLFWFFDPDNWELMVKVVDGCEVNGHHWVFFAGTTDRGVALTVGDSRSGDRLVYSSPPGQPAMAVTDSDAFATCAL